jgi:membrane-bound ClpP family serine protease
MTLTAILLILAIGLILIAIEIFLVPGTTVVGIAGGLSILAAVVCAFVFLEPTEAWITFALSLVSSVILGYFAFRPSTWKKIGMNSTIDGKIIDEVQGFQIGLVGTTLTPCNPIGKAKFGDKIEEVYSVTDFIDTNASVKIENIKENKIFISLIK